MVADARIQRGRVRAQALSGADTPLVDAFCDALWLEDGLAKNTLSSYRRDLSQLALFLNTSAGRVLALAQYVADEIGPKDYVAAFLRPPPTPAEIAAGTPWPTDIVNYVTALNRTLVLVGELNLSPVEIAVDVAENSTVAAMMNPTRG